MASTTKMLRMQERRAPWTHWFRNNGNQPGGVTLLQDFQAAHGTLEDYAGIPANLLDTPRSDPLVLEALVDNNSVSPQPNEFNTTKIEQQVRASNPAEPALNMPMGTSDTWQQIYDFAAGGNAIPVPYHDVKVTDPSKLASLSASYRAFVDGRLEADRQRQLAARNETLLREIHHRVKNNMQVILSLLSVQCENVRDPAARAVITQSESRIRSVSLIHERLYRSLKGPVAARKCVWA